MSYSESINRFVSTHFPTPEEGLNWANRVVNSEKLNHSDEIRVYELLFSLNFLSAGFERLTLDDQIKIGTEIVGKPLETSNKIRELLKRYISHKCDVVFLTIDNKAVTFSRREVEIKNRYLADFENILIPFKKSTLELVKSLFKGSEIEVTEENYDELLLFAEMFDCNELKELLGNFSYKKIFELDINPGHLKYVDAIIYHPRKNFSILQIKAYLWEYFTIDNSKDPCEITLIETSRESFNILSKILILFPKVILKVSNFNPNINPLIRSILWESRIVGFEADLREFKEVDLMYLSSTLKNCPHITHTRFHNLPYIEFFPKLNVFNFEDVKLVEALFEQLSSFDSGIAVLHKEWNKELPKSIEILKEFLTMITPEILRKSPKGITILSEILDRFPSFIMPFYLGGYFLSSVNGSDIQYHPIKYIFVDQRVAGALSYKFQKLVEARCDTPPVYLFRGGGRTTIIKFGYFLENACVDIEDLTEAQNLFKLAQDALIPDLTDICYRWIVNYLELYPSEENDLKIISWAKEINTKMFNNYFAGINRSLEIKQAARFKG